MVEKNSRVFLVFQKFQGFVSQDKKWQRRVMETKFESHIDLRVNNEVFKVYFMYSFKCVLGKPRYYTFIKTETRGNTDKKHVKNAANRYALKITDSRDNFREDCFLEGNCNDSSWKKKQRAHLWHKNENVLEYNNFVRTGNEIFIPCTTETKQLFTRLGALPSESD